MALTPRLALDYSWYDLIIRARPTDTVEMVTDGANQYIRLTEQGRPPSGNPQGNIFFNNVPFQVSPTLTISDGKPVFATGGTLAKEKYHIYMDFDLNNNVYQRESESDGYRTIPNKLPIEVVENTFKRRYYINSATTRSQPVYS